MKFLAISCLVFLTTAVLAEEAQPSVLQECFDKDSISCVQMAVFRKAKEFFEQPKIDLVAGLSVVKVEGVARSVDTASDEVEAAKDVEARSSAIGSFVVDRLAAFFQERSLNWNFMGAARSLSNAIPEDVKSQVRSLVVEARGKKKLLKKLLPLLGIVKLKAAVLGILALLGIGLIAKKALLVSTLSILLSLGLLLKKVLSKKLSLLGGGLGGGLGGLGGGGFGGGHDFHGGGGGGGWSSGGGGWNSYEPHSFGGSDLSHSLAYGGHHKA
ncbi:keratin, type II cytoskeletal I [Phlebotomus argentipes]|uniref:keratin, type II cytoskeletal I n=1 Tax=Phlebotomus argentipes TaxID=94469 RepID=UPI002892F7BF|nr:keratin, type II cytoskeletal I [Phlebotomus argentipes]